ncbi:hypothetical protein QQ045_016458 [Rhodiola kirilowii]
MDVFRNFGEYNMWLAAENGMFLRPTKGSWMITMPEHLNIEWFDSVKVCITKSELVINSHPPHYSCCKYAARV